MRNLPVTALKIGQHTDDGQRVIGITTIADTVLVTVYTPRPDRPGIDARNRATPETRLFHNGDTISVLN